MDLNSFCPECGEEADRLIGDEKKICENCYCKVNDLVTLPDNLEFKVCKKCDRIKCDDDWSLKEKKCGNIEYVLSNYFSKREADYNILNRSFKGETRLKVHKNGMQNERKVKFESKQVVCRECEEFQGKYAKTKLQIRGENPSKVSSLVEKRCSKLESQNHKDFLVDKRDLDDGSDFLLSTEHMSQQVMDTVHKQFDVEINRSYKQIGKENNKAIIQNTVLVKHLK
jgi:NMD protein affecting ribosome stability and mRNA decay